MTTMIQIVTHDAIVLAADSKMIDDNKKDLGATPKLVALSDTVAIATCDLSKADIALTDNRSGIPRQHAFRYDFVEWVKQFAHIKRPTEAIDAVAAAAQKTFAAFEIFVEARAFKERPRLVEYYVVGYEPDGSAVIGKIILALDWKRAKILAPELDGQRLSLADPWAFRAGCSHGAIDLAVKKNGKPYERAKALEAALMDKLLSMQDLTVEEAKRLATALITVEAEANPDEVGLPAQFLVLRKPASN